MLDIALRVDASWGRTRTSSPNFAVRRHLARHWLRQAQTNTGDIKAQCLKAGWNEDYLRKVPLR
jgi:hypothetical protein